MLYLCEIRTRLPGDLPAAERARLLAAEAARGEELVRAQRIRAIWRIVGSLANVSVWDATDHQELHALLQSLPLSPYQDVQVRPLAEHPLTTLADGQRIP